MGRSGRGRRAEVDGAPGSAVAVPSRIRAPLRLLGAIVTVGSVVAFVVAGAGGTPVRVGPGAQPLRRGEPQATLPVARHAAPSEEDGFALAAASGLPGFEKARGYAVLVLADHEGALVPVHRHETWFLHDEEFGLRPPRVPFSCDTPFVIVETFDRDRGRESWRVLRAFAEGAYDWAAPPKAATQLAAVHLTSVVRKDGAGVVRVTSTLRVHTGGPDGPELGAIVTDDAGRLLQRTGALGGERAWPTERDGVVDLALRHVDARLVLARQRVY